MKDRKNMTLPIALNQDRFRRSGFLTLWLGALVMLGNHSLTSAASAQDAAPSAAPAVFGNELRPVDFSRVRLNGGFLGTRQAVNASATLEHTWAQCEATGRIRNFARAAGRDATPREGYLFNDSDVYKLVEGAAYILQASRDPALDHRLDVLIELIAAAQQPDGYLNTYYQLDKPSERWTNIHHGHEMYCAGHLIEAGVAHFQATGKRTLLDVGIRFADHIDSTFGISKRRDVPGHPELELALVRLAGVTGDQKYLALAKFFIDERGFENGREKHGEYAQDEVPLCAQREVVGHAVRSMYVYSGMTDIALKTRNPAYLPALDALWEDLTTRKMYITGGIGSLAQNEGFSAGYVLPNDEAYSETCASIGLIYWSQRMGLLHGDAKYYDVLERVLFNAFAAGVSLDGESFFYANPLGSTGAATRRQWYDCACCPPNVLRLIASLGGYFYATGPASIYVNLYGPSSAEVAIPNADGSSSGVSITQNTLYPGDGVVLLTVNPEAPEGNVEFSVKLRVPDWADFASVRLNGEPVEDLSIEHGYATITRRWSKGDTIELFLPLAVKRITCNPAVVSNRGRVALQYGPVVYCLEEHDQGGADPRWLALPHDTAVEPVENPTLLGGVVTLKMSALAPDPAVWAGSLYQAMPPYPTVEATAIPYYVWANRGAGRMALWIPEDPALCGWSNDANTVAR